MRGVHRGETSKRDRQSVPNLGGLGHETLPRMWRCKALSPGRWRLQAPCPWQAFERNIDRGPVRLFVRLTSIACGLCLSSVRLAVDRALAMKQSHGTWALLPRACCAQVEQLRESFEGASVCDAPLGGPERLSVAGAHQTRRLCLLIKSSAMAGVRAMPIPAHARAWGMRQIQAHTRERERHTDEWKACAPRRPYGGHAILCKEKVRPVGRERNKSMKASGAMPETGFILTVAQRANTFYLYLAEVCDRFNPRKQDLNPLLHKFLEQTSIQCIRRVLIRKGQEFPLSAEWRIAIRSRIHSAGYTDVVSRWILVYATGSASVPQSKRTPVRRMARQVA